MPVNFANRISNFHKNCILAGGGIGVGIALAVRLLTTSPRLVLHALAPTLSLPPLWLMGILWLAGCFLLGASVGYMVGRRSGGMRCEMLAWRGSTFLVLTVAFSLMWYALLFGKFSLLLSLICLPVAMLTTAFCILTWWRVSAGVSLLLGGYILWLLFLLLLQLAVILHN